ncbi:MAG: class I SAM-dependent methyltransferase, partial [Bacteroidetes bacterium]|nr:class I SAM-dependent methyltransferase [Bacteroidota bacterium]
MDHYKENSETWNKLAQLYQDKFMDLSIYNDSYDYFCNSIGISSARILDIGCGPGNISRYLLEQQPEYQLLGIDNAPNMVDLARKNIPNASFQILDCRQISSIQSTFDGIICGFCLPYLSHADAPAFISDCYNLLNQNGILYLSFVDGRADQSEYKTGSTGDTTYFYYYSTTELSSLLQSHHFAIVKILNVPFIKSDNSTESHTIIFAH